MFNLELSIAEWRQQMRAAGVNTSDVLDELESHLRDEVAAQMRSGLNGQEAFEIAVQKIGAANVLQPEFTKTRGCLGFFGGGNSVKANRILGVLWLLGCAGSFSTICRQRASPGITIIMSGLCLFIYAAGIIGGVFLCRGANWGRSVVRVIALVMLIACVAQIASFGMPAAWRVWCVVVAIFSLVSIRLLNSPERPKPHAAT
jgi:hypothetical protein